MHFFQTYHKGLEFHDLYASNDEIMTPKNVIMIEKKGEIVTLIEVNGTGE